MADKNDGPSRRTQIGDRDGSLRTASLLDRLASPEVFWPLFFVAAIAGAAAFFLTSPSPPSPATADEQTTEAPGPSTRTDRADERGNPCTYFPDVYSDAECEGFRRRLARSVPLKDPCDRIGETGFVDLEACLFRRYS
ncbi:MAG: hypothetical protein AAGA22_08345, partial [Pseudomonadota bacterium]